MQHAHNPVNWYAWGEEALNIAKLENKPMLVSIGYAACHWCHVMERESFESEAAAAFMNAHFVNIKIDREERPDIDHIYMDAVQAMTGSGGWPLNVFLTPDAKPFYGGTYFPPVKAFNRSSWIEILTAISQAFNERRDEIESQANNLLNHLKTSNTFVLNTNDAATETNNKALNEVAENILKNADKTWGGFGSAPKFPQTFTIQFLLRHFHFTKDKNALNQALLSLDKMILGGIYDQLGGGFARYSTDSEWLAPHFEKMLYDNALLISVISEAYQVTSDPLYKKTIVETLTFIERELSASDGGFYSALDADSEGVEGKFYTWSRSEIDEILKDDSPLFCNFFDVSEKGNWERVNILRVLKGAEQFAAENQKEPGDLENILFQCKELLLAVRSRRIRPQLDDKVLLSWNALMNTAYSKAYAATGIEHYRIVAIQNIKFLEEKMKGEDGSWFHTYKNGLAKYPAFLDDYANLVQSYIFLQEVTGNETYLEKAKIITEYVLQNFVEDEKGFFFYTHQQQSDVIIRKREIYDGAIPSGNSTMAANLAYLSMVFDLPEWLEHANKMNDQMRAMVIKYPTSFGIWAMNMQLENMGVYEIALTGKKSANILPSFLHRYIPNKVLQTSVLPQPNYPLLRDKKHEEDVKIYLCKNYSCRQPVTSVEALIELL